MPRIPTRRALALVTSAALLASLAAATVAAPTVAAKPKCMGLAATIVGTNGPDRIVGTARRDVIVAKGGADRIFGRGGNDIICGGPGNDRLVGQGGLDKLIGGAGADRAFGGPGPDRLFGGPGPDFLAGQAGNDVLDGGIGVDTCYQGLGIGPVVRCELPAAPLPNLADLAVTVTGPGSSGPGLVPFTVTVKNLGPQATAFSMLVDEENSGASCNAPWEGVSEAFPVLGAGQSWVRVYETDCEVRRADAWVELTAIATSVVPDPNLANNRASDLANLNP